MKKILFLCAALGTMLSASAESISPSVARQEAAQFLKSKGKSLTSSKALAYKAARKSVKGVKLAQNAASYYVFNADNGGYAIVSGDDRTEAILGYADSGSFDAARLPEHVAAWLATYTDEIQLLDAGKITPTTRATRSMTEKAVSPIQPMLKSTWDQMSPYNNLCPTINGNRALTGCLATAFSQVLNYQQWPEKTTAEIPAYTTTSSTGATVSVAAVPAGTVLDWGNMASSYNASSSAEKNNAVATLMSAAGAAMKMKYETGISSAYLSKAAEAARNYFDYPNAKNLRRSRYTAQEWFDVVYGELEAGNPIILGGQSTGGGHAFVCDGYDGEGFFHINWGWSGASNGYFRLSVMNPGSSSGSGASASSDGYAMSQEILVGLSKPTSSKVIEKEPVRMDVYNITFSDTKLTATYQNVEPVQTYFEIGFRFCDTNGELIADKYNNRLSLQPNYLLNNVSYDVSKAGLPNGTYKAYFLSRVKGTEKWYVSSDVYYLIEVNNGTYNIQIVKPRLEILEVSYPGTNMLSQAQEVRVRFKNNTTTDVNSVVQMFKKSDKTYVTKAQAVVLANKENIVSFYIPKGTNNENRIYELGTATDNIFGEFETHFQTVAATSNIEIVKMKLKDTDWEIIAGRYWGRSAVGNYIEGAITVRNKSSVEETTEVVTLALDKQDPANAQNYLYVTTASPVITLAPNETGEIKFKFEVQELNKGYRIMAGGHQFLFTMVPGVMLTKADGTVSAKSLSGTFVVEEDVVAANFRGLTATNITPNSNPNTIYLFDETATVPTSLDGKNVVKGNVAESIVLTDGFDFLAPATFTAKKIEYRRTVDKGADGSNSGWETLVLPFAATKVTESGRDLPWLKTKGDDGKFWLKEFVGIDGATAYYANAQQLQANTPYIVAFPNEKLGEYNLVGKTIVFSAENADLLPSPKQNRVTSMYRFHGNTVTESLAQAFMLNAEGNDFELTAQGKLQPFRACFQPMNGDRQITTQRIGIGNATMTALSRVENGSTNAEVNIYSLSGQLVRRIQQNAVQQTLEMLPAGIYVVNGKKVVR